MLEDTPTPVFSLSDTASNTVLAALAIRGRGLRMRVIFYINLEAFLCTSIINEATITK